MFPLLRYEDGILYRNNKEVGWIGNHGYREFDYEGVRYLVHRVVWYMHHGSWPQYHIDHIDQDKCNNRIENLRDVDRSTNLRNQKKIKGYHRCNGKWRAMYSIDNRSVHIGMYDTEDEARAAYEAAIAGE